MDGCTVYKFLYLLIHWTSKVAEMKFALVLLTCLTLLAVVVHIHVHHKASSIGSLAENQVWFYPPEFDSLQAFQGEPSKVASVMRKTRTSGKPAVTKVWFYPPEYDDLQAFQAEPAKAVSTVNEAKPARIADTKVWYYPPEFDNLQAFPAEPAKAFSTVDKAQTTRKTVDTQASWFPPPEFDSLQASTTERSKAASTKRFAAKKVFSEQRHHFLETPHFLERALLGSTPPARGWCEGAAALLLAVLCALSAMSAQHIERSPWASCATLQRMLLHRPVETDKGDDMV